MKKYKILRTHEDDYKFMKDLFPKTKDVELIKKSRPLIEKGMETLKIEKKLDSFGEILWGKKKWRETFGSK